MSVFEDRDFGRRKVSTSNDEISCVPPHIQRRERQLARIWVPCIGKHTKDIFDRGIFLPCCLAACHNSEGKLSQSLAAPRQMGKEEQRAVFVVSHDGPLVEDADQADYCFENFCYTPVCG